MNDEVTFLAHTLCVMAFLWTMSVLLYLGRTYSATVVSTVFCGTVAVWFLDAFTACPVASFCRRRCSGVFGADGSLDPMHAPLVVKETHLSSSDDESAEGTLGSESDEDEEEDEATQWLNEMRKRYQTRTKPETVRVSDVRVPKAFYEAVEWESSVDLDDMKRGKKNRVDVKGLIGLPRSLRRPKNRIVVRMDGDKPVCEVASGYEADSQKKKATEGEIDGAGERRKSDGAFGMIDKKLFGCNCRYCRNRHNNEFAEAVKRIPAAIRRRLSLADEALDKTSFDPSSAGLVLRDDGIIEESNDGRNIRLKLRKKRSLPAMHRGVVLQAAVH